MYKLYTDGGTWPNPGKGGFGVLLESPNGETIEYSQGFRFTTNNRMELRAIIFGLSLIPDNSKVELYCDSTYCLNAIKSGRIKHYKKVTKPNLDLWRLLQEQINRVGFITCIKIKGHSGHPQNSRCDKLAMLAYSGYDTKMNPLKPLEDFGVYEYNINIRS